MSAKYAFTKTLRELRFRFCHSGEDSAAIRTFLLRAYPTMKKNNSSIPILLREASGTLPQVYARYEFGKERSKSLQGLTDKEIEEAVSQLVKNETA
ncbi:NADH dehydrogenase, alpha subcomplex, subunit 2 [Hypoxylon crocopeplum]|nr:NADH dehydrogenase, alpha subcomplex, subunit 2 [Hypoxylon crocopeplum]